MQYGKITTVLLANTQMLSKCQQMDVLSQWAQLQEHRGAKSDLLDEGTADSRTQEQCCCHYSAVHYFGYKGNEVAQNRPLNQKDD